MKTTYSQPKVNSAFSELAKILVFVRPYKMMLGLAIAALILTAGVALSIGQGIKLVLDTGFANGSVGQLEKGLIILFIITVLLAFGTFCRFYLMSWLGERITADIRKAVFKKIVTLHPSYFEENRSGEIMSRLTTDTTLLQSIIGSSFSMALRSSLTFIGGLVMLLITNIKLTLIVVVCVPAVLLPMFFFGKKVRKLAASSQDAVADIGTYAGEVIQNIKVVQSYTQEKVEQRAFAREVESAFSVAKKRIMQRSFLIATAILVIFCAISVMLWVGGTDVINGIISAGDLGAFVFYAVMVAMSVATIAEVYGELQRAAGAAARLLDLLAVESNIISPNRPHSISSTRGLLIHFNNLSFAYPTRHEIPALDNVNFTIDPGEVVAIVGPSGAGKTTLFELLQRFYDPSAGDISFDNINIRYLDLHCLRQQMAMVPQNPILFSSDVFHNIRYSKPEAREGDVIAAAKQAHAHDFIVNLPNGYHSFLGEQGVRLSGGQKQRIAIARAILKDPNVLLLDEATSALDSESEYHVQAALNTLMLNRTTIIIAHRLSTVMHADKIIVLDRGKILAVGTHSELMKNNAMYQRLCELQFNSDSDPARSR